MTVKDAFGNPIAGVNVTFAIGLGAGTLTNAIRTTGADGIATVGSWTLGTVATTNTVTATAESLSPVTFSATALPGFIQGAGAAVIGATIDFKVKPETKLRVDYTHNWGGGASNLMRDRNVMSISLTSSF